MKVFFCTRFFSFEKKNEKQILILRCKLISKRIHFREIKELEYYDIYVSERTDINYSFRYLYIYLMNVELKKNIWKYSRLLVGICESSSSIIRIMRNTLAPFYF